MLIYSFSFKPSWAQLACILTITYLHIHTHICIWSKTPSTGAEKNHSFWMKNVLQSLLHRERKGFFPSNAN